MLQWVRVRGSTGVVHADVTHSSVPFPSTFSSAFHVASGSLGGDFNNHLTMSSSSGMPIYSINKDCYL